jgi:hypothetical protein
MRTADVSWAEVDVRERLVVPQQGMIIPAMVDLLTFAQIAKLCRTRRRWLHGLVDYAIVSRLLMTW